MMIGLLFLNLWLVYVRCGVLVWLLEGISGMIDG